MSKFFLIIPLIIFIFVFFAVPIFAQETVDSPIGLRLFPDPLNPATRNVVDTIATAMKAIGGAIAVIMILVGAYIYMTSAGDAEKVKTAHRLILWAVIGLAVLLINWVGLVNSFLGG